MNKRNINFKVTSSLPILDKEESQKVVSLLFGYGSNGFDKAAERVINECLTAREQKEAAK